MGWLNLHPTMYLTEGLEIRPPVHDGISGTNVMGPKILLSDIFYVLNVPMCLSDRAHWVL
jgi:hypothetical protein